MLSSVGKELYCAALSCQKTRQVIVIWPPNYLLIFLLLLAFLIAYGRQL